MMTGKTENGHQLRPIGTGGATWEVTVDNNGLFRAEHPAHGVVRGDSYADVTEKARKATSTSKVKVSVPYARMVKGLRGWKVLVGTATGIHGSTGNVQLREGSESRQATHSMHDFFQPPSAEQAAEMIRLLNERDAADKAYRELKDSLQFPGGELRRAVLDAVDKAGANDG